MVFLLVSKGLGLGQSSISQALWLSKIQSCFESETQPLCIIFVTLKEFSETKLLGGSLALSQPSFDKDAWDKYIFVPHKKSSLEVKTAQVKQCI